MAVHDEHHAATDTATEFHRAWQIAAAHGRVDGEGGCEWRAALALHLCHRIGLDDPSDDSLAAIADVLECVQFHEDERWPAWEAA